MAANKRTRRMARGLFRLCRINGALDQDRVRRVVGSIAASKRRGSASVLSEFFRLVRLDRARNTAEVETAAPLPSDLQAAVRGRLKTAYGPAIEIRFSQKPELIGGMRIKVGSDVYDGTVRSQLAELEKSFGASQDGNHAVSRTTGIEAT